MTGTTVAEPIDQGRAIDREGSGSTSWGHFAGMLVIMASTASLWLLVYKLAKRIRRSD